MCGAKGKEAGMKQLQINQTVTTRDGWTRVERQFRTPTDVQSAHRNLDMVYESPDRTVRDPAHSESSPTVGSFLYWLVGLSCTLGTYGSARSLRHGA